MKLNWTNMILCGLFGLSLGLANITVDSFLYWILIVQFIIFGLANGSQGVSKEPLPQKQK
jgi:hypothetical protein